MSATMSLARRNISNRPVRAHLTPREVEEPLAAPAVDRRAPQVESVGDGDGAHVDRPHRIGRVGAHEVVGFLADLDRDVNVVALDAVAGEFAAGEIVTLDPDLHRQPSRFASLSSQVPTTIEYSSGWGRKPSDT